jgi:hypothetical protein
VNSLILRGLAPWLGIYRVDSKTRVCAQTQFQPELRLKEFKQRLLHFLPDNIFIISAVNRGHNLAVIAGAKQPAAFNAFAEKYV